MDPTSLPARLLDQVRHRIRLKHYSIRTEQAYGDWIRRYIHFHGKQHPAAMGAPEIEAFLTDLAVARHVAAATQNQARSALLFLYREILAIELRGWKVFSRRRRRRACRSCSPKRKWPTFSRVSMERID